MVTVQENAKLNRRWLDMLRPHPAREAEEDDASPQASVETAGAAGADVQEERAQEEERTQQTDEQAADEAGAQQTRAAEAQLIEQARSDPAAFGVLYEWYVDRIYAYIYHRIGNMQDAEDLTARTFYRALDNLDSYEDRGAPFAAWLFRIAHNLVANHHRDRSRRRFLALDRLWSHSSDHDTPEQHFEQEEDHAALWSAIDRLPEERRNLLLFKFGSHMSNLEIGELMNKSESAIKSLYFRTLAALRQDLEARGWGQRADSHRAGQDGDEAGGE